MGWGLCVRQTCGGPEVVGQILSRPAITARNSAHVVAPIPLLAKHGIHHVPIVDAQGKPVGIVPQSDLMEALYSYRASLGGTGMAVASSSS